MKRKTIAKKPGRKKRAAAKPPLDDNIASKPFGEYLKPEFTRRLVSHMDRAKKAALKVKE